MTVCMYRDIHTTTSHYWPHTTGMPHLKITDGLRISACCTRGFYFSWPLPIVLSCVYVESSWDVMAHGDAREGKWRGNWSMEWVASTLHTTSEHGVFSFTTADGHTLAVSSRLNWCPRRFKWTRPFRRKTKSGFCACAIIFQTQSTAFVTWVALSSSAGQNVKEFLLDVPSYLCVGARIKLNCSNIM